MTRGRRPLITPTRNLHLHIEEPLMEQVDALLWSEAEGRVPKGEYQRFFTEAIVRMLRHRPIDLSLYTKAFPLEHVVFGFEGTAQFLRTHLERIPHDSDEPRDAVEGSDLAREGGGRDADGGGDDRGDQGASG